MKYIRIILVLLLLCNGLWLFRWEKGPETDFSEMKYDRIAKQSWIVVYDVATGRHEKPLFPEPLINSIKSKIPNEYLSDHLLELREVTDQYRLEINEKQKILDQYQETMRLFHENAEKIRYDEAIKYDDSWEWFPHDLEGACWVVDHPYFTQAFTEKQISEVEIWCETNDEIQEAKIELEKYQKELDMYEREIAEAILAEEAWKKRNQITNVSIGTLAVSVLLVILSFIRFKKTEK
jgi:hypothetical protein